MTSSRLQNIDFLRAVAILAVVAFHYTTRFPAEYYRAVRMPFHVPWGGLGVDLFFIVSGYCIHMTLARSSGAAHFWIRRFARLQPAYVAGIILTFATVSTFGLPGLETSAPTALSNMAWLNVIPRWPQVDGAYWSLVVELKFYFWVGILWQAGKDRLVPAFALFAALGLLVGCFWPKVAEGVFIAPYAPAFLLGLAAYRGASAPLWLAAGALFIICPRYAASWWLSYPVAIFGVMVLHFPKMGIPRPITYVGLVSYPLYLIHQNVGVTIIREVPGPIWLRILLAFAIVFLIAALLAKAIETRWESPITDFLLRIFKRRDKDGGFAEDVERRVW